MKFYGIESMGKFFVHRISNILTHNHRGVIDEGRLVYNYSNERLYIGSESKWLKITTPTDIFETGTKILFALFPLPDNWTIDLTHNDRLLMLTTNTANINSTGGSWTIIGLQQSGNHNHGGKTGGPTSNIIFAGRSDISGTGGTTGHRHTISYAGYHQHTFDGTWRPKNLRMCVGVYN